jgi:hypothetical protein
MLNPRFAGEFVLDPPVPAERIEEVRVALFSLPSTPDRWRLRNDGAAIAPGPLLEPSRFCATMALDDAFEAIARVLHDRPRLDGEVWFFGDCAAEIGVLICPGELAASFRSARLSARTAREALERSELSPRQRDEVRACLERLERSLGAVRDPEIRARPIEDMSLSVRTANELGHMGIETIGQLSDASLAHLEGHRIHFGPKQMQELLGIFDERPENPLSS